MTKTFKKFSSELGTLYFSDSGVNSYAVTPFGVIVADTHKLPACEGTCMCSIVHGQVIVNSRLPLTLADGSEVKLYAKRHAMEVPESLGGFRFGKKVFRTILVPTSEVPVIEVSFEASEAEALVGLA